MSAAMKWGLSVLDWRSHAINELTEHPIGVLKAECGHLLMVVTTLHEKPYREPCEACAALRFDRAMAEIPGRIRPPLSGDGEPDDSSPAVGVAAPRRSQTRVNLKLLIYTLKRKSTTSPSDIT